MQYLCVNGKIILQTKQNKNRSQLPECLFALCFHPSFAMLLASNCHSSQSLLHDSRYSSLSLPHFVSIFFNEWLHSDIHTHAEIICNMKESIMNSTITCQAVSAVCVQMCVSVIPHLMSVIQAWRKNKYLKLFKVRLCWGFNCDESNGTPRCCIFPPAGDCFNLLTLLH